MIEIYFDRLIKLVVIEIIRTTKRGTERLQFVNQLITVTLT